MGRGVIDWNRRHVEWTRPAGPTIPLAELQNTLVVGKPGSGKTTSVRKDIVRDVHERRTCLIIDDPHGHLSDDSLGDLIPRGHEDRIEVLDLTFPDKMFGLDFMPYSDALTEGLRQQADERNIETFAQILGRERELNLNTAPLLGTWIRNPLRLRQKQRNRKPLRIVPYLLLFRHPILNACLDDCTLEKLAWEFNQVAAIRSAQARANIVGPAQRLLDTFFGNDIVDAILSVPPVDLYSWMRQKKIIIIRSNALVSPSATRGIMASIPLLATQIAALHYAQFGEPLPCSITVDEAAVLHLGAIEADLMGQSRKWGVSWRLVYQHLPENEEFRKIRQNIRRYEIFAQGSDESAEALSRQVATMLLDPDKIKAVDVRERTIVRGYNRETIRTPSERRDLRGRKTGETIAEHVVTTPDLDTVRDQHEIRESLGDQYLLAKKMTRLLKTGERLVIDDVSVTPSPQKVIPLEDLWTSESLKRDRIQEALERIRSRPHYFAPDRRPPVIAPPPASREAKPRRGAASRLRATENGGS